MLSNFFDGRDCFGEFFYSKRGHCTRCFDINYFRDIQIDKKIKKEKSKIRFSSHYVFLLLLLKELKRPENIRPLLLHDQHRDFRLGGNLIADASEQQFF